MVFVGIAVPEATSHRFSGYSRAGNLLQLRVLEGIRAAGLQASHAYSVRPVLSYPKDHLFLPAEDPAGMDLPANRTTYLWFVNWSFLKTLTHGVTAFFALLRPLTRPPRVILAYNLSIPLGLVVLMAARLSGSHYVPFVADLPGVPIRDGVEKPLRKLCLVLEKLAMRLADGRIVLSKRLVEDFPSSKPTFVLNGGLDRTTFESLAPSSSMKGAPDRAKLISFFYLGRLDDVRGATTALAAMRKLTDRTGLTLTFVGRGPAEAEVIAAAKIDKRIVYAGYAETYEDVLDHYRDADFLLNPHQIDGINSRYLFPSKLIEYLATGVPVISTHLPCIPQTFDSLLTLTPDDRVESLASAMAAACDGDRGPYALKAAAARRFIGDEYLWDTLGPKLADFLRTIPRATD